jgi:hypothetical protein
MCECIRNNFISFLLKMSKLHIQEPLYSRAYSTYGVEERWIQGFSGGEPEGRNHLEDPCVDGRIILKRIFGILDGEDRLERSGSG